MVQNIQRIENLHNKIAAEYAKQFIDNHERKPKGWESLRSFSQELEAKGTVRDLVCEGKGERMTPEETLGKVANLSRCAWDALKVFLQEAVPEKEPVPGAVIAVQTFGDFLGFNPHCHILVSDGCFYGNRGMFRVAPPLELKRLESIFRHKVFRMLLNKGKITEEMIRMISAWKHSGFHVFCGGRISPNDETAMENLARYIIRASFSQERMQYLDQ